MARSDMSPSPDTTASESAAPESTPESFTGAGTSASDSTAQLASVGGTGNGTHRRQVSLPDTQTPQKGALLAARLRGRSDICRGLFPHEASHEHGTVLVALEVSPTGATRTAHVLSESPRGEGFANAARNCARRLEFEPALDAAGTPTASTSKVRLRFSRTL